MTSLTPVPEAASAARRSKLVRTGTGKIRAWPTGWSRMEDAGAGVQSEDEDLPEHGVERRRLP